MRLPAETATCGCYKQECACASEKDCSCCYPKCNCAPAIVDFAPFYESFIVPEEKLVDEMFETTYDYKVPKIVMTKVVTEEPTEYQETIKVEVPYVEEVEKMVSVPVVVDVPVEYEEPVESEVEITVDEPVKTEVTRTV